MPRKPMTPPPAAMTPEQRLDIERRAKIVAYRAQDHQERQTRKPEAAPAHKRAGQIKQKTRTLTPEEIKRAHRKDAFIAVLSEGWSVAKACREAGIERKSVYEWRESDPEFKARWDQAIVDGLDSVEDIVLKAGERDWRAGEAILKAKRSETWGNRVKSDVTLNASEGLLAALKAIEGTARGLPAADDTPDGEG